MKEIYELWKKKFSNKLLVDHGNNAHHKEGSVLTHTLMVFNETQLDSNQELDSKKFYAIVALLHDLGKPLTKMEKNGKTMFPNHEGVSTFLSVNFLKELVKMEKIDEKEMQDILFTINTHGNIMKYGNSQKHWNMYKYEPKKINLIQTFSKYDAAGSISDIEHKQDVNIEITPEKFSPQNNNEPVVYFTIGIPNSGKLKWLKENYKDNYSYFKDYIK